MSRQPDRKVTWYYEETGNAGKSYLANWLEIWRKAYVITGGKYADITYAFDYQEYVVFDYARDQQDKFPYRLLEDFKNRRVFSTKYESVMKRALSCHLIVFTNFAPDRSKLSHDRWDVHHLNLDPLHQQPAPIEEAIEVVQDEIEHQLRQDAL